MIKIKRGIMWLVIPKSIPPSIQSREGCWRFVYSIHEKNHHQYWWWSFI